jgi:PKD repeat protein
VITLALALPVVVFFIAQVVFAASPTPSFTISDTTPNVGQQVNFDASGSSDADSDITTYEWDFEYDGSFSPTATGTLASHTYGSAGSRSVALRVTDDVTNDGTVDSSISVRSLNVSVPNQSPTASFSSARQPPDNGNAAYIGQTVAFDGRASRDPDGDLLTYEWNFGDGGTAAGPTPTHAFSSRGSKTVTLTVRDNRGGSDSDQDAVLVNALPVADAHILNAQAEPGQHIDRPLVGQPFALTGGPVPGVPGSGSSDADGPISYAWDLNNDGTFETPGQHTALGGFPTPGERTVKLRVTDSNQATAVATLTFRVNTAPTPRFIYEPVTPLVNQPIQFSSTSSDPDPAEQLTYNWDLDGDGTFGETTPLERGPNPSHAFTSPGEKTVTLRVTDTGGITRVLARTILVQLSIPNGGFTFSPIAPLPGEAVTFKSTSSPSAGKQITSVEWDFDYDAATGSFSPDARGASATRTFASPGPKRVAIRVAEGPGGGFDIESLIVVVNAAPQAGFTVAPEFPFAGEAVTISSTSSDPDGPLPKQEWDLDNDGQFDDAAGESVRATFARPGAHSVHLRVTDSRGAVSAVSREVSVRARPLSLLSGVLIQIRGRLVGTSTQLTRLLVRAPSGARVRVRCVPPVARARAAGGCARAIARTSKGRALRFRAMERRLASGTKVIVNVTRQGFLGRYTVIRMRARKEPLRRDRCIAPGADRATRCPGS